MKPRPYLTLKLCLAVGGLTTGRSVERGLGVMEAALVWRASFLCFFLAGSLKRTLTRFCQCFLNCDWGTGLFLLTIYAMGISKRLEKNTKLKKKRAIYAVIVRLQHIYVNTTIYTQHIIIMVLTLGLLFVQRKQSDLWLTTCDFS